jgi:CBS domain-containing protein
MRAIDIMTPNPRTLSPTDTIQRAAQLMKELDVGAVPVVAGASSRTLQGIITDRDIAMRCSAEGHSPQCLIRDHMSAAPLQTVDPDVDVDKVIDRMERAQIRRIPVVSQDGMLLGIIAQADIARRYGYQHPLEVEGLLERVSAASRSIIA